MFLDWVGCDLLHLLLETFVSVVAISLQEYHHYKVEQRIHDQLANVSIKQWQVKDMAGFEIKMLLFGCDDSSGSDLVQILFDIYLLSFPTLVRFEH